jgi:hypothetical protein
MKRKLVGAAVLCLGLLATLAIAATPAALAKAERMTVTSSEAYAAPPHLVAEHITGRIDHLTFDNVFNETSASRLVNGLSYTHMHVITPLVGGSWMNSTRGICYGSSTLVTDDMGVWKGTFAGSISMAGGTYDCAFTSKGVSGAVCGMVVVGRTVNTDGYGFPATLSGTVTTPHGPAAATSTPSFTWYGGVANILSDGQVFPDCPALGNTTILHWRPLCYAVSRFPGDAQEELYSVLYDWNMVLLDEPGPDYAPGDPTSVIPGWHFHSATGIISTVDPFSEDFPMPPPKSSWLWTTKGTGFTTPAGVHYIIESWTGCNKYKGLKAICTWTMADPDFQDAVGKVWILH